MKKFLLLAAFFSASTIALAQCPPGPVLLTTQAEIDNFAANYPGCSVLTHDLRVDGDTSAITNLNGLSGITSAQDLFIHSTVIPNFQGLHNLVDVVNLSIWFNGTITDLQGLSSLESIGDLQLFVNNNVVSINGLTSLQSLGNLSLFQNLSLSDISGVSGITNLVNLTLVANAITSLNGLENIQSISGDINLADEPLSNFNGLANLQSIGGSLYLSNITEVQDLSVFSNITMLENLYVLSCPVLNDLSGLENIQTVNGTLRIGFNPILTDLSEFNSITTVGDLDIYENDNLQSLAGLENLQTITGRLFIDTNASLTSIDAIASVSPDEIDEVIIINNANLSVCDVELVCTVIPDPNVNKGIANNSTGCNSVAEVEAECLLSVSGVDLNSSIALYPNPASEILFISVSEGLGFQNATVFSVLGERLLVSSKAIIEVSSLSQGVYFVEVNTDHGSITEKIVKQ
jgi:hypothetical protein